MGKSSGRPYVPTHVSISASRSAAFPREPTTALISHPCKAFFISFSSTFYPTGSFLPPNFTFIFCCWIAAISSHGERQRVADFVRSDEDTCDRLCNNLQPRMDSLDVFGTYTTRAGLKTNDADYGRGGDASPSDEGLIRAVEYKSARRAALGID